MDRYKINFIHTLLVQQRKTRALSNSRRFQKLNPIPSFWASVACFALFCFMVIRSHEEAFSEKYTVIEKIHWIRPLFIQFLYIFLL